MTTMSAKDLVAEAREAAGTVTPAEAHGGGGLILDVREPGELDTKGRLAGAVHVPRGLLEFAADPDSPLANRRLTGGRNGEVHVLCASGGRAALAAATLNRMGYSARVIEGGLDGWEKAGLPVQR